MSTTVSRPISESEYVLRGAAVNGRVVIGLIFREAAMKFGSSPISYIWTLVEPSILIAILLAVRLYIRNMNPAFGESSVVFMLTGIVALRAVRQIISYGGRAIDANRQLFEFGAVKPPDAIIARTTLEFIVWLLIMAFFFGAAAKILGQQVITNLQGFVIALLQIYFFCIAMAMFNATIGALLPIWRSIWKMMAMPLMLTSGLFVVPAELPPDLLAIFSWNPFLHCVEALRSNSYLDYLSVYDPYYLLSFSTSVLLLSLSVERLFRKEILRSKADTDDEDDI